MKKIVSVILCLAVLFTLSVSAFATESSATAPVQHNVIMKKGTGVTGISANDTVTTVIDGDTIVAKPDSSYGKFDNWIIYKADGSVAKLGTDYILDGGTTLTSEEIKVIAKTDIIIAANYDGKITQPDKASSVPGSPKSGDTSYIYVVVMLAAAAFVLGAKKVYSK